MRFSLEHSLIEGPHAFLKGVDAGVIASVFVFDHPIGGSVPRVPVFPRGAGNRSFGDLSGDLFSDFFRRIASERCGGKVDAVPPLDGIARQREAL